MMPWFPDFISAVELVRLQTRAAGQAGPDWPGWYAQYMADEQAGREAQASPGAGT